VSAKLDLILQRRATLIARAESQRQEIAAHFSECEKPLRLIDFGMNIYRAVRRHPLFLTVLGALLGKLVASRLSFFQKLGPWPGRIMAGWNLFSRVRSFFSHPQPQQ
jgi:hypothetical protein